MQSNPEGRREPEDEAWQAIVDNYGERADLDDVPEEEPPAPASSVSSAPFGGRFGNLVGGIDPGEEDEPVEEEETFRPPPPPPVPRATPDRMAAWIGVFGAPAVLLTSLILGIDLPSFLGYLLVAAFVGGFGYLVYRMPRGPRDPWDDGAQV